ncbi:hypothetical protein CEXT_58271 [Caerostris extrusa]|uniref:Uncharacterized protein n=1 Tax=Caerostris extrusa TaxID=172846 RepID=A0AAV4RX19_CAEEX|nr:hypothetical protein CEXT_58271 [Caerostris extrusa]
MSGNKSKIPPCNLEPSPILPDKYNYRITGSLMRGFLSREHPLVRVPQGWDRDARRLLIQLVHCNRAVDRCEKPSLLNKCIGF